MSNSICLFLLYKTVPGRAVLKFLTEPPISKAAGVLLSTKLSASIVPHYVKSNHIDMERFEVPRGGYRSFNDFFTRKLKLRYVKASESELICPCDGLLTIKKIDESSTFHIKNCDYSVPRLIGSKALSSDYSGGTAFIFRLTPSHYHRYRFCTDGRLIMQKKIPGKLHTVRPIALETVPVFAENSRELTVIRNDSLGNIIQMEVGALMVGKISNHKRLLKDIVNSNEEKGYFEFGGSTIIVIVPGDIKVNPELLKRHKNIEGEIPVVVGEKLSE